MINPWLFFDYQGLAQANSCNPLSWTYNMTGYNMMNVSNPFSPMITLMDQAYWDQRAMSGMYMTPQMNLGFNCGMDSVFNTLLNKSVYDVGSMYQTNGNFGMNPWASMGYFGPSASTSSTSSTSNDDDDDDDKKVKDPTEATHKAKFEELSAFVQRIIDTDDSLKSGSEAGFLTTEESVAIKSALEAEDGTYQTRYNNLVSAYRAVSEETIKKWLLENPFSFKVNGNENELNTRLLKAGYEFKNMGADDIIESLNTEIKNIATETGVGQVSDDIIGKITSGTIDILDLISSWNSSGNSKKLMQVLVAKYNSMGTKNAKDQVKAQAIDPIINALLKEAGTVKDSVKDEKLKKAIEASMKNLRGARNDIGASLSTYFEKLYVYTRLGATQVLEEQLAERFGKFDNRVFKKGMFIDKVKEDLIEEGHEKTLENAAIITEAEEGDEDAKVKAEEIAAAEEATAIVDFNRNNSHTLEEVDAWKNGESIARNLIGNSSKEQCYKAQELIMEITAKDVFVTLAGYEDNDAMGQDLLVHLYGQNYEYDDTEKAELIKHILTCAKENLEAQVAYNKSKGLDTREIEEDIAEIDKYIKNGIKKQKEVRRLHNKILNKYINRAHEAYETNGWFNEFGECLGNFFSNTFDWFGGKARDFKYSDKSKKDKTKEEEEVVEE